MRAFLYLQYLKAGEKKRAPDCEYEDETQGSNTGEVSGKGSGSGDLNFVVAVVVIFPWTGNGMLDA